MIIYPAGTYYIGDPCYVLSDDWDEVCYLIIEDSGVKEGIFTLKDGRQFGIWGTAYGDGVYRDYEGRKYYVESSNISIINLEDITEQEYAGLVNGQVIEFDKEFDIDCGLGVFRFGNCIINTKEDYI